MSTTTTNYGLIKPDTTDPILIGQLNDNSDAIDAALKENADAIENKPDAADIPTPSTAAPAMDGTAAAGTSTDYARADHVHPSDTSKQNALSSTQLAAVNSGINSTKVEQIETNKNNILWNTQSGVKNLFNLTKVSGTYNTVVFTVNSDKTVTVSGTASPANSNFNLDDWTCTKAGTYVVSGAPSGGSWAPSPNTYRIRVAVNGTWKGDDVGNGFALTLAVGDVINLQINTSTTYTANNLVFKPMITLKSLYNADPTYQSYAMSNAELTNGLYPTAYTKPTSATGIFLQSGGYCMIGNICVVCLRFSDSSAVAANTVIFSDLPIPVKDSTIAADRILAAVANNKNLEINITSSGNIRLGGTALSGTNDIITASVVYPAQY